MRSSWKSNKGLQGEQLYTSIIPLGCYGMFFHQTTVCQALVQMEKALTCLRPTTFYMLLAGYNSLNEYNFELSAILRVIVLAGWISGHLLYHICWRFPNGWMFRSSWLILLISHTKNSNERWGQWVNTQCPCQGGLVSWLYSIGGSTKKFITLLVCQTLLNILPPPLSNIWA